MMMAVSANMGAQNQQEEEIAFSSFEEVKAHMELVFSGLEKQRVPYGILLDKSLVFDDITKFSGVYREPHLRDTVDGDRVLQIASTLSLAKMDTEDNGIIVPPQDVEELWEAYQLSDKVVLSGIYYKYARFKNDESEPLIEREGQVFYDKYLAGIWQNPYEVKQSFTVAPVKNQIKSLNVKVQFPKDLWWTNMGDSIRGISIDFGIGEGFKAVDFGGKLTVNFPESGSYLWRVKMDLVDGKSIHSQSSVNVVSLQTTVACDKVIPMFFKGTRAYLNEVNEAMLEIRYARADCIIRKPLIVAEGYDSGLNPGKDGLGEAKWKTFLENYTNAESFSLIGELSTYDIIYINWESGADYLQRNAYLLQDIIKYVNRRKAESGSTEPNVVLGQSMGGVIARYALRDMENRNEDHQTRLYISQDAPHQGAHIPQAVLIAANDVAYDVPSIYFALASRKTMRNNVRAMLQAAGTQQLVKEVNESSGLFDDWQQELRDMGYPQKTRNIAMSNGSGCGFMQDIYFSDLIVWGHIPAEGSWGSYGGINLEIYASPNIGNRSLGYYIRIYNRIRISKWSITNVLYRQVRNITSSKVPLDIFAGGNYDFKLDNNLQLRSFNFVPVYSGLDVGSGVVTFNVRDYLKRYRASNPPSAPRQIPFDNFITAFQDDKALNEKHLAFSRKSADWLAMELQGDKGILDHCTDMCGISTWRIEGPDVLCATSRFSVKEGAAGYNWYISEGGDLATLSIDGNAVFLTRVQGKKGKMVLSADLGCNIISSKSIWVGEPKLTFDYERTYTWSRSTLKNTEEQGITNITWERLPDTRNNFCPISFSGSGLTGTAHGSCYNWNINARVTAVNACGATSVNASIYPLVSRNPNYDGMYPQHRIQPQSGQTEVYEVVQKLEVENRDIEYIPMRSSDKVRFTVHTYGGKEILKNQESRVDLEYLRPGVYIINAVINDFERVNLKVIKN